MDAIIYYTDGRLPRQLGQACFDRLLVAAEGAPVIAVVPWDFEGWDIRDADPCVPVFGVTRGTCDIYTKIMSGLLYVLPWGATVGLAEHDVLYPPGYGSQTLEDVDFSYPASIWCANESGFFLRPGRVTSCCIADVGALKASILMRLQHIENGGRIKWSEPGTMGEGTITTRTGGHQPIDIRHGGNLTGTRNAAEYVQRVPWVGNHADLWADLGLEKEAEENSKETIDDED